MQNTVEREIKSLSDAVFFTPEKLKLAVKSAIKEEDRSRNVIVFGLREEASEQVEDRVSELGGKPRIQASRIGRNSTDSTSIRPVKVILPNSTAAHQVLQKAKFLKRIKAQKQCS